jgi:phosphohistidine phosphatase SixA
MMAIKELAMPTRLKLLMLSLVTFVFSPAEANTVYLVRHAEKQGTGTDPALTGCGQARAAALADYFADIKLQAVFSTSYQRTQQTAAGVASSKQLAVIEYEPRQPEKLVQQLTNYNQAVLVVGHSNTVPQLVTLLSDIEIAPLTEQDYTMLYQVELGEQVSVTLRHQAFSCNQ